MAFLATRVIGIGQWLPGYAAYSLFISKLGPTIQRSTPMLDTKYLAVSAILAVLSSNAYSAEVSDALGAGWNGERRCENLYEDAQIRILRCTFPPNIGHERHSHPAFFNYILNGGHGQVTDASGTREFESKTDQYREGKAVEWHEMLNTGETTLRYLIVEKKYEAEK
jgi:hypothetical protein